MQMQVTTGSEPSSCLRITTAAVIIIIIIIIIIIVIIIIIIIIMGSEHATAKL